MSKETRNFMDRSFATTATQVNAKLEQAARLIEAERPPIMGTPHLALMAAGIRALKVTA